MNRRRTDHWVILAATRDGVPADLDLAREEALNGVLVRVTPVTSATDAFANSLHVLLAP
jgi:hypothetical protein